MPESAGKEQRRSAVGAMTSPTAPQVDVKIHGTCGEMSREQRQRVGRSTARLNMEMHTDQHHHRYLKCKEAREQVRKRACCVNTLYCAKVWVKGEMSLLLVDDSPCD